MSQEEARKASTVPSPDQQSDAYDQSRFTPKNILTAVVVGIVRLELYRQNGSPAMQERSAKMRARLDGAREAQDVELAEVRTISDLSRMVLRDPANTNTEYALRRTEKLRHQRKAREYAEQAAHLESERPILAGVRKGWAQKMQAHHLRLAEHADGRQQAIAYKPGTITERRASSEYRSWRRRGPYCD